MELIDYVYPFVLLLAIVIFALVAYKHVYSFKQKQSQVEAKEILAFNLIMLWNAISGVLSSGSFFLYYVIAQNNERIHFEDDAIEYNVAWFTVFLLFAIATFICASKVKNFERQNPQSLFYFVAILAACVILSQVYSLYLLTTFSEAMWEYVNENFTKWLFMNGAFINYFLNTALAIYLIVRFSTFKKQFYQMFGDMPKEDKAAEPMPASTPKVESTANDMKLMKRCPYCGERILEVAKKCKHCGEWLNK